MPEFRCSRCRTLKEEDQFGLNRNDERKKICTQCFTQLSIFQKDMKTTKFNLNDDDWKQHPTHKNYFGSKFGLVVNGKTKKIIGCVEYDGYIRVSVNNEKIYSHRFIYECFNGLIEDETLVINHINEKKSDNRIENLELITQGENHFKSSQKNNIRMKPRPVIGTNQTTNKVEEFKSAGFASKKINICNKSIQQCADGRINTTKSKTNGDVWTFIYKI